MMRVLLVRQSQVAACPIRSLLPNHYRDDGTCRCFDTLGRRVGKRASS